MQVCAPAAVYPRRCSRRSIRAWRIHRWMRMVIRSPAVPARVVGNLRNLALAAHRRESRGRLQLPMCHLQNMKFSRYIFPMLVQHVYPHVS